MPPPPSAIAPPSPVPTDPAASRCPPPPRVAHVLAFLSLASLAALALLVGRRLIFDERALGFLPWNLFLAWMPVFGALGAAAVMRSPRPASGPRRWWLAASVGIWFFFFPNAPYLVTDLLHLRHRAPVPMWFDLLVLCSFAWLGVLLGFIALQTMQRLVTSHWGTVAGWAASVGMLALSCLGVFVGRFWRWHSHDLLLPHRLWAKVSANGDVLSPKLSLLFLLTFGVFSAIVYGGLYALTHQGRQHDAPGRLKPERDR